MAKIHILPYVRLLRNVVLSGTRRKVLTLYKSDTAKRGRDQERKESDAKSRHAIGLHNPFRTLKVQGVRMNGLAPDLLSCLPA